MQLPDLHDATLVSVHLDWATGLAILAFRASTSAVQLTVTACTELVAPRREEWGRSVSVLSVSYIDGNPEHGVRIEMQSGDVLIARGRVESH